MKVGIDVSSVVYGTGVSVYTRNLVKNLLSIDKENEYLLFGGTLRRKDDLDIFFNSLKGNFKTKSYPVPPTLADFIWNRLHILPIELFSGKVDVFHFSDWTQPPSKAFKVTTVHDLSPIKFPRLTHPKIISTHRARLRWVEREVDILISPSLSTKEDLIKMGIKEKKIRVIPEAPSPIFKPARKSQVDKLKKNHRISGKYLLAVGLNPRKNTQRIIEAFHLARAGKDLKLVLTGEPVGLEVEEGRDIRLVGHVEDSEMPVFYTGAEALIYPSIYEGYGLPILEAYSCKCPVVTSNISSMPEVAGKAALLVDPYDTSSIVNGIEEALKNKKDLIKKGQAQVKRYTWEKTAKETLNVYKEYTK